MTKFYLLFFAAFLSTGQLLAQMFTPPAGPLPNGDLNEVYTGQVIDFAVPQNATISGEFVVQALSLVYPQTQPVLGFLNIDDEEFPIVVDRTTLQPDGLPAGLGAACDASPCTYIEGASGYLTIAGTPTQAGEFQFDILTWTEGAVDISSITGGILSSFGLPTSLGLPIPVPSSLDEEGYTILIQNTSGIPEQNELFDLSVYPNPISDASTISMVSKEQGLMVLSIYDQLGRAVSTQNTTIKVGNNTVSLDTEGLTAGVFMVVASMEGYEAQTKIVKQ